MTESDPPLPDELLDKPDAMPAPFAFAKKGKPQCIGHRGYKAAHPENSMAGFRGAVDVGVHAIETDVHLSKDGVVVISHDANLKRCFGKKEKIIDCEWSYLETLRTVQEPHAPMPRLKDLLEFLTEPGMEGIWLMLDMKPDNDAEDIVSLIASTIAEVKPSTPWNQRIVLGCWTTTFLPLCKKYLPGYPISHIGFSITYARQFLKVPNVSFNMMQSIMVGPYGNAFMKDVKDAGHALFLWTVNDEMAMKWSIYKDVDGIVTDDPKKYLEICESYQGEKVPVTASSLAFFTFMNAMDSVFGGAFKYGFAPVVEPKKARTAVTG